MPAVVDTKGKVVDTKVNGSSSTNKTSGTTGSTGSTINSIADAQAAWAKANAAGDTAGMNAAHAAAEAIRAKSGYSGGADGSQHIALNSNTGSNIGSTIGTMGSSVGSSSSGSSGNVVSGNKAGSSNSSNKNNKANSDSFYQGGGQSKTAADYANELLGGKTGSTIGADIGKMDLLSVTSNPTNTISKDVSKNKAGGEDYYQGGGVYTDDSSVPTKAKIIADKNGIDNASQLGSEIGREIGTMGGEATTRDTTLGSEIGRIIGTMGDPIATDNGDGGAGGDGGTGGSGGDGTDGYDIYDYGEYYDEEGDYGTGGSGSGSGGISTDGSTTNTSSGTISTGTLIEQIVNQLTGDNSGLISPDVLSWAQAYAQALQTLGGTYDTELQSALNEMRNKALKSGFYGQSNYDMMVAKAIQSGELEKNSAIAGLAQELVGQSKEDAQNTIENWLNNKQITVDGLYDLLALIAKYNSTTEETTSGTDSEGNTYSQTTKTKTYM